MDDSVESSQQDDMSGVQWILTQTKEVKCNYTWTIDNFKLQCEETETGESIKSPCFSVEANDNIKWCLELYPNGRSQDCNPFASLYLKLISCEKREVTASCVFSILNGEYIKINIKELQTKHFKQGTSYGYHNFIGKDYLLEQSNGLLNKLTICCKVSLKVDTVNISGQGDLLQMLEPRQRVSYDLGKLYDNMTLSDVTLVAGGKEMRAHKAILAARSSVFAAMFEHDMQEQKLSRVDITIVDYDTLTKMLRYIYTGHAPNIDTMAAHLLVAADHYVLDELVEQCEEALYRSLSVETAADTLILADDHGIGFMKRQTIAFINSRQVGMVMETEGWKKMISTHPHLVVELFSNITVQLQQHLHPTHTETEEDKDKLDATFRYIVQNFKNLKDTVQSPPCYVRNLPWKIMVKPRQDKDKPKYLAFYLECNTDDDELLDVDNGFTSWSCYAKAELKILSHKPEKKPFVQKVQRLFCRMSNSWGYPDFMKWSDVLNPENGYVKDDAITLEVHVTTGMELL